MIGRLQATYYLSNGESLPEVLEFDYPKDPAAMTDEEMKALLESAEVKGVIAGLQESLSNEFLLFRDLEEAGTQYVVRAAHVAYVKLQALPRREGGGPGAGRR